MTILDYSPRKGIGHLTDGETKATFRIQELHEAGFQNLKLPEGLPMEVEIDLHQSGHYRVTKVVSVNGKAPSQMNAGKVRRTKYGMKRTKSTPFRSLPVGAEAIAEVHSYEEKEGYGFMTILGDENRDVRRIFFHVTNVPKEHKQLLAVGAIFRILIGVGKKGSTALVQEPYFSDAELEELAAMPMQLPDGDNSDDEAA